MEIEFRNCKECKIEALNPGDVFAYGEHLLMKIDNIYCFNLNSFILCEPSQDRVVKFRQSKLIIY